MPRDPDFIVLGWDTGIGIFPPKFSRILICSQDGEHLCNKPNPRKILTTCHIEDLELYPIAE